MLAIQNALTTKSVLLDSSAALSDKEKYCRVDVLVGADGRISSVTPAGEKSLTAEKTIDATDCFMLPGLVNGHTHSPEVWTRALVPQLPLELWLPEIIEFGPSEPESFYYAALLTGVDLLLSGATCIMDHIALTPGNEMACLEQAVRAYREVGIRAVLAPLIGDLPLEDSIPASAEKKKGPPHPVDAAHLLAFMEAAVKKFHAPDQGIYIAVGPTGFQRCSDELFKGCIALSNEHGLIRHTHLLETRAQVELAKERFEEKSAVAHLENLGWFNERTTNAHAVNLTEEEIKIVGAHNSSVVHNPMSNMRLGSGTLPMGLYRRHSVNVALGCDGSASEDSQHMLEAVKIASMIHNPSDPEYRNWLRPFEALAMGSEGGARGLGLLNDLGTIEVGKLADVFLLNLRQRSMLPRNDPLTAAVYGTHSAPALRYVLVAGRVVVDNGEVVTTDVRKLERHLYDHHAWDLDRTRTSALRAALEPQYRSAMGLPNP